MKPKAYLIFHLNLNFSSIEEADLSKVVDQCYGPLLDMISRVQIPCGIELTSSTLKKIKNLRPGWIESFRQLISEGQAELIGSGYHQIIGPLVPYEVNFWNQYLGVSDYREILQSTPSLALVNEMAFSDSLVGLYDKVGYRGIVMERNNILLSSAKDVSELPKAALDPSGITLPVVWGDSIMFQKVQQFVHGDITLNSYMEFLRRLVEEGQLFLPIYCNDAEVFDYRPGRFSEETKTHTDGEWNRFECLLKEINSKLDIDWVKPSQLLDSMKSSVAGTEARSLASAAQPIPVKKQPKYNITRWAVTGRHDLWLNTLCHRIYNHLKKTENSSATSWRSLCEFWKSDHRTHTTDTKWRSLENRLLRFLKQHKISSSFARVSYPSGSVEMDAGHKKFPGGIEVAYEEEGTNLKVITKSIRLILNLRRGMTIRELGFLSHDFDPCIGSLPHGYFSDIRLGADYYSGGIIAELPMERKRLTDLSWSEPVISYDQSQLVVCCTLETSHGTVKKGFKVSPNKSAVSLFYDLSNWTNLNASVRLGILTLLRDFSLPGLQISTKNGGENFENFLVAGKVRHTAAASSLVSASSGFGATSGEIDLNADGKSLSLSWDPSDLAVLPMLEHHSDSGKFLTRLYFSQSEMDETTKMPRQMGNFQLEISSAARDTPLALSTMT